MFTSPTIVLVVTGLYHVHMFYVIFYIHYNELFVAAREGFHPGESENDDATITKAFLITMSVAAAYILLVVGLMIWCRYRRRSRKLPITEGIIF